MKRFFFLPVLALFLLASGTGSALAQAYPPPTGFVNDFAGVLSGSTNSQLSTLLLNLEQDTSAEVAVVTISNLDGVPIEDYANGLFNAWGIGKNDKDNGILFLVSLQDRKVWIEVGYGLEPIITDGRAGRILDNYVIPDFRNGDYDQGIAAGVMALEGYIRDGTPPSVIEENPVQGLIAGFHLPSWLLITLGIITIYMLGFMARTKSVWLGGIWGFILGLVLGFGFGNLWAVFLLPFGLGIFGTILDIILSSNYWGRVSSGRSTGWYSSGGGFSGGGSGFGGFGGGSSGGGGAGRGW